MSATESAESVEVLYLDYAIDKLALLSSVPQENCLQRLSWKCLFMSRHVCPLQTLSDRIFSSVGV